jgi:parvulin-like peptidyl-prolyl isomerase
MPKKLRTSKHESFVSKRQESIKKKQKRTRNITISVVLVVVIAAISTGVWAYYDSQNKGYNQAAIRVNDVTFDLGYYINTLKIYYGNVSPGTLESYTNYGKQEVEELASYVEQQIIQSEIIKQGSSAFGVQIERSVIKDMLKESGTPVTDERIDLLMAQELVEKQVPSTQQQVNLQVMLLESESVAREAISRMQAGESFEDVSDNLSKVTDVMLLDGNLGWVTARETDLTLGSTNLGDMVFRSNINELSNPVYDEMVTKAYGYWVMKVIERNDATDTTAATVQVKGILVGSEQKAYEVIDRLNAGEDIDELAKEVSELSGAQNSGAQPLWMTEDQVIDNFKILFDMPVNEISTPIGDNQNETKGGYWVFNVLEKDDNKELTSRQQNLLVNDFLEKCSAELEKDPDYNVESLMTEEMRVSAINEVVLAQGEGSVLVRTNSLPYGEAKVSYYCQLEAYGNQKGNTWYITEGRLPDGLSLDGSTGVISGTPNLAGGYSLTIVVDSGLHYGEQDYTIRVYLPVSVTTSSLPEAQVEVDYLAVLEAFGDSSTFTWSIIDGELPDGIYLDEPSGYIYGTPTTAGTYGFTVQVDDGVGKATQALSLTVQ